MKALTFQVALTSTILNLRITIIILLSHLDIYIYILKEFSKTKKITSIFFSNVLL